MVRTLDFHSNNAGSNPAGLIMFSSTSSLLPYYYKTTSGNNNFKSTNKYSSSISYELHFASLISPAFSNSGNFINVDDSKTLPKKIHLKKSYLAMSWFNYLHESSISSTLPFGEKPNDKSSIKPTSHLAILPSKRSLYTLVKAPMAHKTNSKEQFMFKFYFFKFSITLPLSNTLIPDSIDKAVLTYFLVKDLFPVFETNLLFLKYYQIMFPYKESNFFNFNLFRH